MHKQNQCNFPPAINIHASAWFGKDRKEAKLLNVEKKSAHKLPWKRTPGNYTVKRLNPFFSYLYFHRKLKPGGGSKIEAHTEYSSDNRRSLDFEDSLLNRTGMSPTFSVPFSSYSENEGSSIKLQIHLQWRFQITFVGKFTQILGTHNSYSQKFIAISLWEN